MSELGRCVGGSCILPPPAFRRAWCWCSPFLPPSASTERTNGPLGPGLDRSSHMPREEGARPLHAADEGMDRGGRPALRGASVHLVRESGAARLSACRSLGVAPPHRPWCSPAPAAAHSARTGHSAQSGRARAGARRDTRPADDGDEAGERGCDTGATRRCRHRPSSPLRETRCDRHAPCRGEVPRSGSTRLKEPRAMSKRKKESKPEERTPRPRATTRSQPTCLPSGWLLRRRRRHGHAHWVADPGIGAFDGCDRRGVAVRPLGELED